MSRGSGRASSSRDREAMDTLRAVLNDAGLAPKPLTEAQGFTITFDDDGPNVDGMAHILDGEDRFVFLLIFRDRVPDAFRPSVMEFLTRVNYGMAIGGFEMDLNDGEVRFRCGVDFRGQRLPPWLIRNSIVAAMDAVEAYAQGLEKVATGESSGLAAYEAAEAFLEASSG